MLKVKKLNDSVAIRWGALVIIALTMMAAYYVNDVMAPLKELLEDALHWDSREFGIFTGAYSFLNVFLLMLIWGGLILDKFGSRFTGKLATILMVGGTALEYYAITYMADSTGTILGYKSSVMVASAGYSIFGVGAEVAGITVTKIIAKWFKDKEDGYSNGCSSSFGSTWFPGCIFNCHSCCKKLWVDNAFIHWFGRFVRWLGGILYFLCT